MAVLVRSLNVIFINSVMYIIEIRPSGAESDFVYLEYDNRLNWMIQIPVTNLS